MIHTKTILRTDQVEHINNCVYSVSETGFEMDMLEKWFNKAGERIMKMEYLYKIFRITEIERNKKNESRVKSFGGDREWGNKLL